MSKEARTAPSQLQESRESRLLGAGFTRRLEFWVSPDGQRALSAEDAIAALDSGEIEPGMTLRFPDTGVRALPDELVSRVERIFHRPPPSPPDWLEPLAVLVAKELKPIIRSEVRAALRGKS
jgi:hypothetical protein